jgi:hypothetical protein
LNKVRKKKLSGKAKLTLTTGRADSGLLAALDAIGEESKRNGTNRLTMRQIDGIIKAARAKKG